MSEQNRQEEAARNDRQRLEQQAVESRQLSERALAEERQRQEIRRMQTGFACDPRFYFPGPKLFSPSLWYLE